MKSLYIVPTRGRPHNALRLAQRFADRDFTSDDTDLFLVVDDDDPERDAYLDALAEYTHDIDLGVTVHVSERLGLGGSLNHWTNVVVGEEMYDAIGFMGDDHLPQTRMWDVILAGEAMRVTYGNDLLQGPMLPTMVLMDVRIIEALGWFIPPGMKHLYLDNFWKELGEYTGTLRYCHDAVVEHIHPHAGKAPNDAGYDEVNSAAMYDHDFKTYELFKTSGEFNEAVQRVIAVLHA